MGVYYLWCCPEEEEFIDPGVIDGGGIKDWPTKFGGSARLAAYLIATNQWESAHRISDCGDAYPEVIVRYKDITEEAIREFNREYLAQDLSPEPIESLLRYCPG